MTDHDEIVSLLLNAAAHIPGAVDPPAIAEMYAVRLARLLERRVGLEMKDGMFQPPCNETQVVAEDMLNRNDVTLTYQLANGGYIQAILDDEPHWLATGRNESGQVTFNNEYYSLVEMWQVIKASIEEAQDEADSTGS